MNGRKVRGFMICVLVFALVVSLFIAFATPILRPRRLSHGAMWESFLAEEKDTLGALFLGSSLAYCDVIPALIYEKSEIPSFVLASPVQPMPLSYFYLCEALKTQSPSLVAIEVSQLYMDSIDVYTQVGIDYMPFGKNKLRAIFSSEADNIRGELLFPMEVYHSRWDELSRDDFSRAGVDMLAGYTYLSDATGKAAANREVLDASIEEEKAKIDRNYSYLDKIHSLCRERGIVLFCFLSPSADALGEAETAEIARYLEKSGVPFVDYSHADASESLGLSESDWFDSSHLNVEGAKKLTTALCDELENLLPDYRCPQSTSSLWEERIDYFYSYKE